MIEIILHLIFKIMMFIFYNGKIEKRLNNILIEKVEVGKNIRMIRTFYSYHKKDNEIDLMCGYKGLYVILLIIFTAISSLKSIF